MHDATARTRLVASGAFGLAVGAAATAVASWRFGLLTGWMAAGLLFVAWMWATMWPMSAGQTRRHAGRQDPGMAASDLVVLGAAVASLGAVVLLLSGPASKDLAATLSVASVALAWAAVHTVFTARYARLYYREPVGGVDFHLEDGEARYRDFAYLAFTVGMTFQVSDTELGRQAFRDLVLKHMLLSYLLGAVVIATTINLVAGLAK